MRQLKIISLFVFIIGMIFVQSGCAGKAKPAPSAGFVTSGVMASDATLRLDWIRIMRILQHIRTHTGFISSRLPGT